MLESSPRGLDLPTLCCVTVGSSLKIEINIDIEGSLQEKEKNKN